MRDRAAYERFVRSLKTGDNKLSRELTIEDMDIVDNLLKELLPVGKGISPFELISARFGFYEPACIYKKLNIRFNHHDIHYIIDNIIWGFRTSKKPNINLIKTMGLFDSVRVFDLEAIYKETFIEKNNLLEAEKCKLQEENHKLQSELTNMTNLFQALKRSFSSFK
jgi:hypothetical protein